MRTTEVVARELSQWCRGKIHLADPSCAYVFVMTKSDRASQVRATRGTADSRRCRWCRHLLVATNGPGRKREFCSQRCRQWDWVARHRASELELSENELVVAREELDELKDLIYVLHCAVIDARRDLEGSRQTVKSLTEVLGWLLEAAEPVAMASLSPSMRP